MTTRVLPPEEWPRLVGTEAERLWPVLEPTRHHVVVVEHDGVIVGVTVLMWTLHAESVWIHPAHRGRVGVWRRLRRAIETTATALGARVLFVTATLPVMQRFFAHLGASRLAGDTFVWRVEGQHGH